MTLSFTGLILSAAIMSSSAWAYDTNVAVTGHSLPAELESVGVTEHLGDTLDLDSLTFTDDEGVTGPLRRFFTGHKPVLMAMVYYNCPGLCSYHLNGLTDTMKQLKWTSGDQFEVVAVSMDSRETPDLAAKKKRNYLDVYKRPEGNKGWHFLVGDKANVGKLAAELGFRFKWLEDKKEFAHVSVAYVITSQGKISRYLHGIQPDPSTLKLSLIEASSGKIGTIVEQAMMFCFQFDPHKNKYVLYSWNLMRIGAILMVLLLAVLLLPLWWREQSRT
jgi:protein SCO1/2